MTTITESTQAGTATVGAPLLRVQGLHKSFTFHAVDGRQVDGLRGVDLTVNEAEHVSLAGLSGAGKSSLLKCVHRTYVIEAGSISYRTADDEWLDLEALPDVTMASLRGRDIGYVSQFLRAEPRRGVYDVVERAARRQGVEADEAAERARRILGRLRIDESLWATYPTLLSGGEKQRVNLATGIVVPPRLLLLDEPVSALDPLNREAVLSLIDDLPSQGTTVLSVFHDLDAIARLADRVVVMVDGRVVDEGPAARVLETGLELDAT
ncbi:MAG: ATP-binding cassette domain-containing protein [Actinomycetota bacterium]